MNSAPIIFSILPFGSMNLEQLYSAMALRQRVFVVEQECPYLDADGIDEHCLHVLGMQNDVLVAYARILPPGLGHVHPCIGRVVTSPEIRGTGAGKDLMRFSIASVGSLYGPCTVHISAQSYLERFYRQLGFFTTGHEYLEDNIPHMAMELNLE